MEHAWRQFQQREEKWRRVHLELFIFCFIVASFLLNMKYIIPLSISDTIPEVTNNSDNITP